MTIHYLEHAHREEECSITTDRFDTLAKSNELSRLPCGHMFQTNNIVAWLLDNHTCPNCRSITNELAIRRVWDIDNLAQAIILREPPFDTVPALSVSSHIEEEPVILPAPMPIREHERPTHRIRGEGCLQFRIHDASERDESFACSIDSQFFVFLLKAITDFGDFIKHIIDFDPIEHAFIQLVEKVDTIARKLFA